jgi:DNA-binding NarL/FixJ family response regulator
MSQIKIGICDRQTLIRTALTQLLSSEDDIEVVWSVPNLSEVFAREAQTAFDILLIDFTSPTLALLSEVSRFKERFPAPQIVAMTDHGQDTCVLFQENPPTLGFGLPKTCCLQQAFMMGARGAVRKTSTREELLRVLYAVQARHIAVEEPSLSLLMTRIFGQGKQETPQYHLTEREQEVIRALALGKSNKEIAVRLGIREQTVKNHISHILEKLGLEDRLQIVVFAARYGLIALDQV